MGKGDIARLKADPDDGTVPVARLFMDALAMCRLTALELRAVLFLMRWTYGWIDRDGRRFKERAISYTVWASHLGMGKNAANVNHLLRRLIEKHVIVRTPMSGHGGYRYRMNTNVGEWMTGIIDKAALRALVTPQAISPDSSPEGQSSETTIVSADKLFQPIRVVPGDKAAVVTSNKGIVVSRDPGLGGKGGKSIIKSNIKEREETALSGLKKLGDPDPETLAVFENTYREAVGIVTPQVASWLAELVSTYSEEWFQAAVKEACASTNCPNPGYISRILERWGEAGRIDSGKPKRPGEVYRRYNINLATMKREETS